MRALFARPTIAADDFPSARSLSNANHADAGRKILWKSQLDKLKSGARSWRVKQTL
jgi:hypothetical protein